MLPLLLLQLLSASLLCPAYSSTTPHAKDIFILAGQSNMVGLGGVVHHVWDGVIPRECQPNPSILRLSVNLTWVEAREPIHGDIDAEFPSGIGPGMPFANALLARKGSGIGVVGLVPCAIGGTSITQWRKGTHFYDEMVKRADAALRLGGTLRAVLWYQGESDTESLDNARYYKLRFQKFVHDLRADLRSPNLPLIQVALASGTGPFIQRVRAAQLGVKLPYVRCVDAKGLPLDPDGLHLSTPAQVTLGQKLAQAFLQTLSGPQQKQSQQSSHSEPNSIILAFLLNALIISLTFFSLCLF